MSILLQLMPAEEQKSASHRKCPLFWKSLEVTARSRDAHNWTENVLKDRSPFQTSQGFASNAKCFQSQFGLCFTEQWCPSHPFKSLLFLQSAGACPSCHRREARPWTTAYSHCLDCRHLNAASECNILNAQPSLCVSREPINTVMSWPTSPMVITVLVTLLCASRKMINTNDGLLRCGCVCDSEEFIKASPLKCTFGSSSLRHRRFVCLNSPLCADASVPVCSYGLSLDPRLPACCLYKNQETKDRRFRFNWLPSKHGLKDKFIRCTLGSIQSDPCLF